MTDSVYSLFMKCSSCMYVQFLMWEIETDGLFIADGHSLKV